LGARRRHRHERVARRLRSAPRRLRPGESFYPARDVRDGMRLNFSNSSEEKLRIGIERIMSTIRSVTK